MSSRLPHDLESLLDGMIVEHRNLLALVGRHGAAMKAMDLQAMEVVAKQQDACRARIATFDRRRAQIVISIAREQKLNQQPTLSQIAELYPANGASLREKRDTLKKAALDVALRTNVASKLAGAVLGHLNTAVRAISSAVQSAGVYTSAGLPKVGGRIGAMEAVG